MASTAAGIRSATVKAIKVFRNSRLCTDPRPVCRPKATIRQLNANRVQEGAGSKTFPHLSVAIRAGFALALCVAYLLHIRTRCATPQAGHLAAPRTGELIPTCLCSCGAGGAK